MTNTFNQQIELGNVQGCRQPQNEADTSMLGPESQIENAKFNRQHKASDESQQSQNLKFAEQTRAEKDKENINSMNNCGHQPSGNFVQQRDHQMQEEPHSNYGMDHNGQKPLRSKKHQSGKDIDSTKFMDSHEFNYQHHQIDYEKLGLQQQPVDNAIVRKNQSNRNNQQSLQDVQDDQCSGSNSLICQERVSMDADGVAARNINQPDQFKENLAQPLNNRMSRLSLPEHKSIYKSNMDAHNNYNREPINAWHAELAQKEQKKNLDGKLKRSPQRLKMHKSMSAAVQGDNNFQQSALNNQKDNNQSNFERLDRGVFNNQNNNVKKPVASLLRTPSNNRSIRSNLPQVKLYRNPMPQSHMYQMTNQNLDASFGMKEEPLNQAKIESPDLRRIIKHHHQRRTMDPMNQQIGHKMTDYTANSFSFQRQGSPEQQRETPNNQIFRGTPQGTPQNRLRGFNQSASAQRISLAQLSSSPVQKSPFRKRFRFKIKQATKLDQEDAQSHDYYKRILSPHSGNSPGNTSHHNIHFDQFLGTQNRIKGGQSSFDSPERASSIKKKPAMKHIYQNQFSNGKAMHSNQKSKRFLSQDIKTPVKEQRKCKISPSKINDYETLQNNNDMTENADDDKRFSSNTTKKFVTRIPGGSVIHSNFKVNHHSVQKIKRTSDSKSKSKQTNSSQRDIPNRGTCRQLQFDPEPPSHSPCFNQEADYIKNQLNKKSTPLNRGSLSGHSNGLNLMPSGIWMHGQYLYQQQQQQQHEEKMIQTAPQFSQMMQYPPQADQPLVMPPKIGNMLNMSLSPNNNLQSIFGMPATQQMQQYANQQRLRNPVFNPALTRQAAQSSKKKSKKQKKNKSREVSDEMPNEPMEIDEPRVPFPYILQPALNVGGRLPNQFKKLYQAEQNFIQGKRNKAQKLADEEANQERIECHDEEQQPVVDEDTQMYYESMMQNDDGKKLMKKHNQCNSSSKTIKINGQIQKVPNSGEFNPSRRSKGNDRDESQSDDSSSSEGSDEEDGSSESLGPAVHLAPHAVAQCGYSSTCAQHCQEYQKFMQMQQLQQQASNQLFGENRIRFRLEDGLFTGVPSPHPHLHPLFFQNNAMQDQQMQSIPDQPTSYDHVNIQSPDIKNKAYTNSEKCTNHGHCHKFKMVCSCGIGRDDYQTTSNENQNESPESERTHKKQQIHRSSMRKKKDRKHKEKQQQRDALKSGSKPANAFYDGRNNSNFQNMGPGVVLPPQFLGNESQYLMWKPSFMLGNIKIYPQTVDPRYLNPSQLQQMGLGNQYMNQMAHNSLPFQQVNNQAAMAASLQNQHQMNQMVMGQLQGQQSKMAQSSMDFDHNLESFLGQMKHDDDHKTSVSKKQDNSKGQKKKMSGNDKKRALKEPKFQMDESQLQYSGTGAKNKRMRKESPELQNNVNKKLNYSNSNSRKEKNDADTNYHMFDQEKYEQISQEQFEPSKIDQRQLEMDHQQASVAQENSAYNSPENLKQQEKSLARTLDEATGSQKRKSAKQQQKKSFNGQGSPLVEEEPEHLLQLSKFATFNPHLASLNEDMKQGSQDPNLIQISECPNDKPARTGQKQSNLERSSKKNNAVMSKEIMIQKTPDERNKLDMENQQILQAQNQLAQTVQKQGGPFESLTAKAQTRTKTEGGHLGNLNSNHSFRNQGYGLNANASASGIQLQKFNPDNFTENLNPVGTSQNIEDRDQIRIMESHRKNAFNQEPSEQHYMAHNSLQGSSTIQECQNGPGMNNQTAATLFKSGSGAQQTGTGSAQRPSKIKKEGSSTKKSTSLGGAGAANQQTKRLTQQEKEHQNHQNDEKIKQLTVKIMERTITQEESFARPTLTQFKGCKCKNTMCLKLYCECLRNNATCGPACQCTRQGGECRNNCEHDHDRSKAIEEILKRNILAFESKVDEDKNMHFKGCKCKASECQKKYCECFERAVPCTALCKCCHCKNTVEDFNERRRRNEGAEQISQGKYDQNKGTAGRIEDLDSASNGEGNYEDYGVGQGQQKEDMNDVKQQEVVKEEVLTINVEQDEMGEGCVNHKQSTDPVQIDAIINITDDAQVNKEIFLSSKITKNIQDSPINEHAKKQSNKQVLVEKNDEETDRNQLMVFVDKKTVEQQDLGTDLAQNKPGSVIQLKDDKQSEADTVNQKRDYYSDHDNNENVNTQNIPSKLAQKCDQDAKASHYKQSESVLNPECVKRMATTSDNLKQVTQSNYNQPQDHKQYDVYALENQTQSRGLFQLEESQIKQNKRTPETISKQLGEIDHTQPQIQSTNPKISIKKMNTMSVKSSKMDKKAPSPLLVKEQAQSVQQNCEISPKLSKQVSRPPMVGQQMSTQSRRSKKSKEPAAKMQTRHQKRLQQTQSTKKTENNDQMNI